MNRRVAMKLVLRLLIPLVVLVVLLGALPLYGRLTANSRMSPQLRSELSSGQEFFSVQVRFGFRPQYFNLQKLQAIGTVAGVSGNSVKVLDVDAAQVRQIASFYWTKRVETTGEAN